MLSGGGVGLALSAAHVARIRGGVEHAPKRVAGACCSLPRVPTHVSEGASRGGIPRAERARTLERLGRVAVPREAVQRAAEPVGRFGVVPIERESLLRFGCGLLKRARLERARREVGVQVHGEALGAPEHAAKVGAAARIERGERIEEHDGVIVTRARGVQIAGRKRHAALRLGRIRPPDLILRHRPELGQAHAHLLGPGGWCGGRHRASVRSCVGLKDRSFTGSTSDRCAAREDRA